MSKSQGFFHELLPWAFITKHHEGVVVHKDGILQRSFAYRAPDIDCAGAFEINNLALRVNDFTKRLGSGWAFHVEARRFCTREYLKEHRYRAGGFTELAPYLIDREREEAFNAAGRHFESSYYLTFSWKPPSENAAKLAGMFVAASREDERSTMKENVEHFVNTTNDVVSVISNDMLIAPLDNEETAAYLHSAVSLKSFYLRFPCTQILLDRILPDMELQNSLPMTLGGFFIPIIGVNDFPDATYPAILDALNRARLEYRWVVRFICLSKEEGKKEAGKKEKHHRGSKKTFLQTFAESTSGGGGGGVINHGASVKEADAIDAGIEIETDEASLGYLTSSVMVYDENLKTAKEKADLVKSIINSAGFTCKEETFNALGAWRAMLPGDVYSNYRALPVMSYNLSHVIPLSSVWAGMRHNEHAERVSGSGTPHLTCGTAEGTPFFLNLNPTDVGHTVVGGPTGAGKSTCLNLLEAQFFKYPNSQVVVFDKGKSCRTICLACGGAFYEPASDSAAGCAFQPLAELETERDILDAQDFIETCITASNKNAVVDSPMRAAIKATLSLMSEKPREHRTLTSFVQYANSAYQDPDTGRPVLKNLLGDFLWEGGKYGKIFDSSAQNISIDTRFLVFEMERLMSLGEQCIPPALVYLFNVIDKKFDGRLSMLVLDEAWLFLKNETFADKIAEWLKVLRKKNVFVVFATQDLADVMNSPLKTTVIQQCLTKIYLADPAAATDAMADVYGSFGLTESEISLIASARMKRDYFYTCSANGGRRLFQLDLGPLALALIGAPDHKLLDALSLEYGQGVPLCRQILDAKRVNYERYIESDAPEDKTPEEIQQCAEAFHALPPLSPEEIEARENAAKPQPTDAALLAAAEKLPAAGKKGAGRAVKLLADEFGVSKNKIYWAKSVLASGNGELIAKVREGALSLKKADKLIADKITRAEPQTENEMEAA